MLSSGRFLLQSPRPTELTFLQQPICFVSQSPVNQLANELQYAFPKSPYLANQFVVVMQNQTIKDAFNRAMSFSTAEDRKRIHFKSPPGEIYGDTAKVKSFTTSEGKTAIIIRWVEEDIRRNLFDAFANTRSSSHETYLFLSDKEIIFIPAVTNTDDIDQLHYYLGMSYFYSYVSSCRAYVDSDVIREVTNHEALVKTIGKLQMNIGHGYDYGLSMSYRQGSISIFIEENGKKETHVFSKYYSQGLASVLGMFKAQVSYEKMGSSLENSQPLNNAINEYLEKNRRQM